MLINLNISERDRGSLAKSIAIFNEAADNLDAQACLINDKKTADSIKNISDLIKGGTDVIKDVKDLSEMFLKNELQVCDTSSGEIVYTPLNLEEFKKQDLKLKTKEMSKEPDQFMAKLEAKKLNPTEVLQARLFRETKDIVNRLSEESTKISIRDSNNQLLALFDTISKETVAGALRAVAIGIISYSNVDKDLSILKKEQLKSAYNNVAKIFGLDKGKEPGNFLN